MNPIKLSQQLQDTLVSYLTTTFDVNRDGQEPALAAFIQQSFNRPQALFAGPYLELTPPYKTAENLQELVANGVISPQLLEMDCFKQSQPLPVSAPLYTHQAEAIRKLCTEERNIVVSSGTGSGKTECFLIPILNDLLLDKTEGVRAVLVYPLNALVNDQLDRLRELLRGTDITFGRYTSELEERAEAARRQMKQEWEKDETLQELFNEYPLPNEIIGRDQIQEQGKLPQILITNYAMLEYLLLRPQDSPLFAQGKWRFVVLDEAHTYAGAQGIEVGLLMRRLKLRLGHQPGQMRCIATSATLTNDDAADACQFAKALFGEEFTADDIIFGEPNHADAPTTLLYRPPVAAYVHERFDALIDTVRQERWESTDEMALLMQEIGLIDEAKLSLADTYAPQAFLWEILRNNQDVVQLRQWMAAKGQPLEVMTVAEELFRDRLPADQHQNALYHLIELAAMARPAPNKASLLPARYHLFVRPPQGVWVCLNPTCPEKHADNQWSKLFATPRETCDACQSPVFPLVVCRTCGQVYVRLQKVGKQYLSAAAMGDEPQQHYATWRSIHENRALAEQDPEEMEDEETLVEQAGESTLKQSEMILCLACQQEVRANGKCGCPEKSDAKIKLYILKSEKRAKLKKQEASKGVVVDHMNECGRCHSRAIQGTEIATEITMNALTPLAVLTDDLYRSLPESSKSTLKTKAGGGRKLLSFYDSRQGAARFAAFVQDVVNQLQPEKGHETLYVVREVTQNRVWFAEPLLSGATDEIRQLFVRAKEIADRQGLKLVLWISDKQDAFLKCVADVFPDVPHRFCANHFFRDLAKPVLALDSTAKKKMRAKIRGLRALEREVLEAQQAPQTESGGNIDPVDAAAARSSLAGDGGAVVLDFCSAVRGILNDNHGGPCNPPGIRMVDALADVQESLARIAASGNLGPAFSLLDRLQGFIDRGVAEQQDTFSRVRGYTAQVREVVEFLTVEDGSSLADREPLFAAKIAEFQSFSDDKTYHDMAKMMTSFQVGLFAGAELTDYPHDNLNLERWFRLPKSHERRIHGHHHAGIRIVREGATLIPTLDAHAQHPGVFTEEALAGFATATAPASQLASQQRHGVMQKARSKKSESYS